MPILSPNVNEKDADLFSEWKKKEKMKFDAKSKQLPELFKGSNVAYLNTDLKSCSIGTIHARRHDGHSYQILTETGLIISRNHMHLRPTGVKPVDRSSTPCISNVKANKPIIAPSGEHKEPTPSNATKGKPSSIKTAAKTNDVPHRTRSGREVCNLHAIENNYVCMHLTIIVLN